MSSRTIIAYANAAHFLDHYAMLIFAAAVVVIAPTNGLTYGELLSYATPGFIAFGAGSLAAGWLGDCWSRRHMMLIFFLGIGGSLVTTGLSNSPTQLGVSLFGLGLFASIYHPVGTAMVVSHAQSLGKEVGINGVWGNAGIALSALGTGLICQTVGWRFAFFVPGLASIVLGVAFAIAVPEEIRPVQQLDKQFSTDTQSRWRTFAALGITILATSVTFNGVTITLPQLLSERVAQLAQSPGMLGLFTAGIYAFGAVTQFVIGHLLDRHSHRSLFLAISLVMPPVLYATSRFHEVGLIVAAAGVAIGLFGQITVNDAMVGAYTSEAWRARAYAIRYFFGFSVAGLSVGLIGWLHDRGGFELTFQALAGLCVLVVLGALLFPAPIAREVSQES